MIQIHLFLFLLFLFFIHRDIAVDLKLASERIALGKRSLPARPALKMWTAIILLPLISSCVCDHSLSVLNGRGVRVMRISRLTSEEQCRQACQSPAAPGELLGPRLAFQLGSLFPKGLLCPLTAGCLNSPRLQAFTALASLSSAVLLNNF